ncbi:HAMP domain-containing sensor histidine kinase [Xanthobacteraceae bacterium Astr-EGSB]|uniref:sensor histidine kinase n=1 Tax=Astrobacterium formosum TaxID=3069710 RepID=UPI0027B482F1|nr:HAMP domain-containing sensor histidine kinase [Xanthobacteraceae bacterium Astr-EGSB]
MPLPTRPSLGLSGKLLILTLVFVMVAEVLIYVPSIANFRITWLRDRLAAAHTAALVLDAAPSGMVPESLARQILDSVGARAVAMKTGQQRRLLATTELPAEIHHEVDVRSVEAYDAIVDAFVSLFLARDTDIIRAVGPAPMGGDFVEIVLDEGPLRAAMWRYSRNILLLSLAISAFSAALVYLALHYQFVRPMRRLIANMAEFRADPEDRARTIVPTGRDDEIGVAEVELARMQHELAAMLQQKSRLASLGLAVSKINHDLRNLLASAQLISDRLAQLADPSVQRFAPKLLRTLERAIAFCQSTLSYGRAQEPPPDRHMVALEPLVEEVRETLGLADDETAIGWIVSIDRGLQVDADREQLLRALLNLTRNARQALETRAPNDPGRDQIRVTGRREGAVAVIEVSDTGPGLSDKARAHLFEAFQGSTRTGGAGLGLVIAAELVKAHGGDIRLIDGTIGATFRITIPDRAVALDKHRAERARA